MKKRYKIMIYMLCGVVLFSVNASAQRVYFNFSFTNSGKQYQKMTNICSYKNKDSTSWIITVDQIAVAGDYGIQFCPVLFAPEKNEVIKICKESSVWIQGITYDQAVAYAPEDIHKQNYRLAARMDDLQKGTFQASGYFCADGDAEQ